MRVLLWLGVGGVGGCRGVLLGGGGSSASRSAIELLNACELLTVCERVWWEQQLQWHHEFASHCDAGRM
jgi:hypothetical protein